MALGPEKRKFKKLADQTRFVYSDNNISDDLIKVSPYVYYTGMTYTATHYKDCSRIALHHLIKTGRFTELNDDILHILSDYQYLNSYLIRKRLSHLRGQPEIKKEAMREVLRKMVNYGLLVQYELIHTDANGHEQGSPFIYGLTSAGERHLREQRSWRLSNNATGITFTCSTALRILAENQFSIMLEHQYEKSGIISYCDFSKDVYNACGIRMLYGIQLPDGGELALFVFAVRNDPDWSRLFLSQLRRLKEYMSNNQLLVASVLVIVDTEWLSMACERCRCCENDLKGLDVFYATDTSFIMEDHVFDRLIEVKSEYNYSSRSIFRLDLEQPQEIDTKEEGCI